MSRFQPLEARNLLSVTPIGVTLTPTEGSAFTTTVATFTTTDEGPFSASIEWGDGTTTDGSIVSNGGTFSVTGTHTYTSEGDDAISVLITDPADSTTAAASSTAVVSEADALTGTASVHATEGVTFNGAVATFTDTGYPNNDASDLTATIDWGDGTTTSGSVSGSDGVFTVSGQHLYGSDLTYPLVVMVADDAPGTATATALGDADIADNDTLVPSAPLALAATEGVTVSGVLATFTDTTYPTNTPDDFISWIDWGDGTTTSGTVSGSPGSFTVSGSHVYSEEGTQTATIELDDDTPDTASSDTTATINVADASLSGTAAIVAATEGAAFNGVVASFTDAAPDGTTADYSATIQWGDGSTTSGTIAANGHGGFDVTGTHSYLEEGSAAMHVVVDDARSELSIANDILVSDAPLAATAVAITLPEYSRFSAVVATFTDADPNATASDYSATISWGPGQALEIGRVVAIAGGFEVLASNDFAEDGMYTAIVHIDDLANGVAPLMSEPNLDDGPLTVAPMIFPVNSTATVADSITITEPSISVSPITFTGHERSPLINIPVATFQHGDGGEPSSGFTATIYWGDGTSSAGSIVQSGTTYTVLGSHVFLDEGAMPLLVHITDDTTSATVVTSGRIFEELLPNGSVGTANERFIAEVYRDLLHRQVDKTALPYWSNMLDQGQSRLQVVQAIINTSMQGELGADLVQGMYEKYLGREVDAAGLAFWMNILNFHETLEQTESNLVATDEFFVKAGGTNDGYVTRLFELALGREPDTTARANFDAALAAGMSREQVAEIVFGSNEYHAKTVAGYFESSDDGNDRFTSTTPFSDDLDFLDRPADAAGLGEFTAAMDQGLTDQRVWADFLSSNEFFAKTA